MEPATHSPASLLWPPSPDYLIAPPGSETVTAPGAANYTLSVSPVNNFTGAVNFSAAMFSNAPPGVTIDAINPVGGGTGSTTMTVHVPNGYPPGNYGIAISSSSSTKSHIATAHLTVLQGADFTLTATGPQAVAQGGSASYTISMAPLGTFSGTVTLNMGAITGGVSGYLSSTTISPGAPATLTLSASSSAYLGTYPISVNGTATNGGISHAALATLGVGLGPQAAGSTVTLGTISVPQGGATVIVASPLDNGDTITGCSAPGGITATLDPVAQTIGFQAASGAGRGTVACTTARALIVQFPIYPGWGSSFDVSVIPLGSGNWELDLPSDFPDEFVWVTVSYRGTYLPVIPGGGDGDTQTFTIEWAAGAPCGYYRIAGLGFDEDDSPIYASSSAYLCAEEPPVTYTISGQVTSSVTGAGMPGVRINLVSPDGSLNFSQVTDPNGNYSYTVSDPGTYTVTPSLTGYWFTPPSSNVQANQTANFAATPITTVFLIHGIGQGSPSMQQLYTSLSGSGGVDPIRFQVDAGFDFSECAANQACSMTTASPTLGSLPCSLANGGKKLADYILSHSAPGGIVLVATAWAA